MDQRVIDLYDHFTHGRMTRRHFLDRLAEVAGSATAAVALLPLLQNDYARAETVPAGDPRLATDTVSYESNGMQISGELTRLKAKGKRPTILVIHENRGLNPHTRDVGRRFAVEGFLAFAIDMLSPFGGTPSDEDKAREMFQANVIADDAAARIAAAVPFLARLPESSGNVGVVGFCWGGGMANRVALLSPDVKAVVAYYGPIPADKSKVADIKAPLLLHYGALDANVNPKIPEWEAALTAAHKPYTIQMYPNAQHSFFNDASPSRYNKEAAELSWGRTLAFFKEYLGAPPKSA